jgi:hypothetical protein
LLSVGYETGTRKADTKARALADYSDNNMESN